MAKKSGGNKSAAIRDYYAANPDAKPKAVLAALTEAGIDTTTAFISTIRTNMKKGKVGGKRGRPAGSVNKKGPGRPATKRGPGRPASKKGPGRPKTVGRPAAASSVTVSVDSLIQVKKVVDELGSIEETRAALTALEKLLR